MEGRLAILEELGDYKVAEGEPNPEGWEVVASDGVVVGKVDHLIVDTTAMKVRYLDCEVDESGLGLDHRDRHVLIPVGHARLKEDAMQVVVDAVSSSDIAVMRIYKGLPLEREDEQQLRSTFPGPRGGEGHA